jgi:L-ascorbate metabolism protein UlaG (beta-lactamase superfamily)
MPRPTKLTLIGNEDFRIDAGPVRIFIDAFYNAIPGVAGAVADAARRTGAAVIGPGAVVAALRGQLPDAVLAEMNPAARAGSSKIPFLKRDFPAAAVTAFRTFHGQEHNSYLIELPGFRRFHDGDNEKTQRLEAAVIGKLDALLIGPWQGSSWVKCIERLAPRRFF